LEPRPRRPYGEKGRVTVVRRKQEREKEKFVLTNFSCFDKLGTLKSRTENEIKFLERVLSTKTENPKP